MDDRGLHELSAAALKSLEIQERAFKAGMQAQIDHYNSVLAMTRAQLQGVTSRQELLKVLEVDQVMSW